MDQHNINKINVYLKQLDPHYYGTVTLRIKDGDIVLVDELRSIKFEINKETKEINLK